MSTTFAALITTVVPQTHDDLR